MQKHTIATHIIRARNVMPIFFVGNPVHTLCLPLLLLWVQVQPWQSRRDAQCDDIRPPFQFPCASPPKVCRVMSLPHICLVDQERDSSNPHVVSLALMQKRLEREVK